MPEFSIELFNTQHHLVQKTIEQIDKDFAGYASPISISDITNASYQNILDQLAASLNQIAKGGAHRLSSLLYRIDMPEKFFPENYTSKADYFLMLADAVIRREFFKVTARIKYSQNN